MISISQLQGVWSRNWIEANGIRSNDKRVQWAQSGDLFVDVRIPVDRPDVSSASCLEELETPTLASLLDAEGFAGTVSLQQDICTWTREINWHGETSDIDAGTLTFTSSGELLEDGVHASYREEWRREADIPQRAYRLNTGEIGGIIIFTGNRYFAGIAPIHSHNPNPNPNKINHDTINNNDPRSAIRQKFGTEYSVGSWDGKSGIAKLCTNPLQENQLSIELVRERLTWHQQLFDGTVIHSSVTIQPC